MLSTMLSTMLLGLFLAQAPTTAAGVPPPSASQLPATVSEQEFGKSFRLKSEHFLTWRAVSRPMKGWTAERVEVWRVELSPTAPRLSKLVLSVETIKAEQSPPIIHPRLEYAVDKDLQLGLDLPVLAASATTRTLLPVGRILGARPALSLRGRF